MSATPPPADPRILAVSLVSMYYQIILSCSLQIADITSPERFEPLDLSIVLGTVLDSPLPQIIVIS